MFLNNKGKSPSLKKSRCLSLAGVEMYPFVSVDNPNLFVNLIQRQIGSVNSQPVPHNQYNKA